MPRGGKETPGEKAERLRHERNQADQRERNNAAKRKWRERNAEAEAERKSVNRRSWQSYGAPEAPETRSKRSQRDKRRWEDQEADRQRQRESQSPRMGDNEQRVAEYLRNHPEARVTDVAFHAIYGGGSTAWEGLHSKTKKNAAAEASRVITRLQQKGVIKIAGYTLGGKPKYVRSDYNPPKDDRPSSGPIEERRRGRKSKGSTDKGQGSVGFFNAPGGASDTGKGTGKGSLGFFSAPGSKGDEGGDDDGPRDGKII